MHWASLWGRPQRWHAERVPPQIRKEEERKTLKCVNCQYLLHTYSHTSCYIGSYGTSILSLPRLPCLCPSILTPMAFAPPWSLSPLLSCLRLSDLHPDLVCPASVLKPTAFALPTCLYLVPMVYDLDLDLPKTLLGQDESMHQFWSRSSPAL